MDQIIQFFINLPIYYFIAGGTVLVALIVLIVLLSLRRRQFRKNLESAAADPDRAKESILGKYPQSTLLRKSGMIVDVARSTGSNLPEILNIGDSWIDLFNRSKRKKYLNWTLEFVPHAGLFTIFSAALENKKIAVRLQHYLDESRDFLVLRKIALSGRGQEFDGNKALALLDDRLDEIREMTGDPEWASRYFAVKMLLHDEGDRSRRAVWESFGDSHALVRMTVVNEIDNEAAPYDTETESASGSYLYDELNYLLLNDPVLEVRKAAKARILKDFHSYYQCSIENMNNEQILHVIQLLNPESEEDKDLALRILDGDDLELRQSAARYLQKSGVLSRLFRESHLSDMENLNRNYELLRKAVDINVTVFLNDIQSAANHGSLLTASRLLKDTGNQKVIRILAKEVFSLSEAQKMDPDYIDIYRNTLSCIQTWGCDEAVRLLNREAEAVSGNEVLLKEVLVHLPERGSLILLPLLDRFLKEPEFLLKDELRKVLLKMPEPEVIEMALDIINKGRSVYSHPVRIQALKLLGEMEKEYCLQTILENLTILPLEEGKEFARMLSSYAEKLFDERVASILKSVDAHSRASVIVCLPATEKKTFIKEIHAALDDANPEVRIAAIWALIDYKDTKQLLKSVDMLRDPVENVRKEVAKALGTFGTDSVLKELEQLLENENEVDSVKEAAITGLTQSGNPKSVEILVRKISLEDDFKQACIRGLSAKRDKKCVSELINQFKDAGPQLRDDISMAVQMMGYDGEEIMVKLLKEDIPSLHRYIAEVLESSGFVESNIRKLKNRDPKIRKDAADFLSSVRTRAAFRGIVLAARDPNSEVRVSVTKALEVLNSEDGTEILKDLENDPDRKVRKYTLWALERIKTKGL